MKPIGSHGDIGSPEQGEHRKGARAGSRDELIIVHSDDAFDIDAVFRAEEAAPAETPLAEAPAVEAPPVEAPPVHVSPVETPPVQAVTVEEAAAPPPPIHTPPVEAASSVVVRPEASIRMVTPAPAARADAEPRPASEPGPRDRRAAALLIADLIDNHVHLEWHEAVAIAQHLCQIMAREPGANMHRSLVEPWNIEITDDGEVQVLPGGSSSDPIVKQVGRVLRVLLQDTIAPAELRLVASQASFEVPVYSSVDELSAALRHFERPDNSDAIRAAFNRGLEAKLSGLPVLERTAPPPAVIPKVVEAKPPVKRTAAKPPQVARQAPVRKRNALGMFFARAAGAALVAGTAIFLTARFSGILGPWSLVLSPTPRPPQTTQARPSPAAPAQREDARGATPPASTDAGYRAPAAPAPAARSFGRGAAVIAPPPRSFASGARGESASIPPAPVPRNPESVTRPAAVGDSIEASLRRAAALLAEGRDGEAAVILDGIVMKNPLYQLDPARFTPETLAAFQNSKRLLLPAMARRYLQEARIAYDAGDFALALTKGERAQALLRDADIDPGEVDLNNDVANLMAMVTAARTLEESRVYTSEDRDVTPPRPIGRQLSTASLSGRAPQTGRLEIVVGRSGEVETVKLETPVNGYHDRMIVSAAKAWHYRPAMRKGHAVRYSMVMSITLPDF